ncbi:hypothetical protein SAMN05444161_8891 [Rhizobiales bacterium GAS191]|nr:hypothetical protein SAMN05444161_8891 [Rhizobiales bacterium GAS191]
MTNDRAADGGPSRAQLYEISTAVHQVRGFVRTASESHGYHERSAPAGVVVALGEIVENLNARINEYRDQRPPCGLGDRGLTCKLIVDEQVDDTTEVFVARIGAHLPPEILQPRPMDLPVLIRKTDSGWDVTTLGR